MGAFDWLWGSPHDQGLYGSGNEGYDALIRDNQTADTERANAYRAKGELGSYGKAPWDLHDTTYEDPSQSRMERLAERHRNFYYGGTQDAAGEAADRAYGVGQRYGQQFSGMGGDFLRTGNNVGYRQAPTVNTRDELMSRGQMGDVYSAQMRAANAPEGPSAAQATLNRATNANLVNNLTLAGSGRGMGESASAMDAATRANAAAGIEAGNNAAILRAQENADYRNRQLAALGAAGTTAGNIRSGDANMAQYGSDLDLRSRALNDTTGLGYGQLGVQAYGQGYGAESGSAALANDINKAALTGSMGYEGNLQGYYGIHSGVQQGANAAQAQREAALYSAGGAVIGTMVAPGPGTAAGYEAGQAASDIHSKTEIKRLRTENASLRSKLPLDTDTSEFAPARPHAVNPYGPMAFDPTSGIYRTLDTDVSEFNPAPTRSATERLAMAAPAPARNTLTIPDVQISGTAAPPTFRTAGGVEYPVPQAVDADQLDRGYAASDAHSKKRIEELTNETLDLKRQLSQVTPNMGQAATLHAQSQDAISRGGAYFRPLPRPDAAQDMVREAPGYSYEYKNPSAPGSAPGTHYGPMAQDLERTPVGRSVVEQAPNGTKVVNGARLALANTAALNGQQEQLDDTQRRVQELTDELRANPEPQASMTPRPGWVKDWMGFYVPPEQKPYSPLVQSLDTIRRRKIRGEMRHEPLSGAIGGGASTAGANMTAGGALSRAVRF